MQPADTMLALMIGAAAALLVLVLVILIRDIIETQKTM